MRGIVGRGVAIVVVLALAGTAAGSALAESMPGSSESLRISASDPRQVGRPMTVPVEGVADGAHRLFVYGASGPHGCAIEHVEGLSETALTPAGGETLAAGPFLREYAAVPVAEGRYIICAYLDAPPERPPGRLGNRLLPGPVRGLLRTHALLVGHPHRRSLHG
jgi:hypothetical protein